MRRTGILLAVGALALAWWLWPAAAEAPVPATEAPARVPTRKVTRFPAASDRIARAVPRDPDPDPTPTEAARAEDPALGELVVDVVDEDGRPEDRARLRVTGCTLQGSLGRGAYQVQAPGRCVIQAWRRDGLLYARSAPVEVEVLPDQPTYAQVEVRSARTGGLGVGIHPGPDGVRVMSVYPGTPAAELGLQPGDLILEVDGEDARDLPVDEFIARMTGPEGSQVHFVVQPGDDPTAPPEPLILTRRFVERS